MGAPRGHFEVVKYLVENGANIDIDDAFRCGSCNGHLGLVKYLVEKGADIHDDNDYALKRSTEEGHFEVVKYLLENGANISILSEEQILGLIEENIVVNDTSSKLMQDAWDILVQPIRDNKKKLLDQAKIESMNFLLKPGSLRVKIVEHQFTYQDNREEYRYMD